MFSFIKYATVIPPISSDPASWVSKLGQQAEIISSHRPTGSGRARLRGTGYSVKYMPRVYSHAIFVPAGLGGGCDGGAVIHPFNSPPGSGTHPSITRIFIPFPRICSLTEQLNAKDIRTGGMDQRLVGDGGGARVELRGCSSSAGAR